MPRGNPKNPHSTDEDAVQHAAPIPVLQARVESVDSHTGDQAPYHTATIRVYGDPSPYQATVVTPSRGDVNVPVEGEDVAVAFGPSGQPYIVGSWYAADKVSDGRVNLPDYEPGERIIGTPHNSSYIKIEKSGRIEMVTDGFQPVDIDHQSSSAYLDTDQSFTTTDPIQVEFDTENNDPEDLFDPNTHEMTLRHDGSYNVKSTVEIVSAGQENLYTLYIYRNGSPIKHKNRQSSVNEPLSVDIDTDRRLDADDTLAIYIEKTGGTQRTLNGANGGEDIACEFNIKRTGI